MSSYFKPHKIFKKLHKQNAGGNTKLAVTKIIRLNQLRTEMLFIFETATICAMSFTAVLLKKNSSRKRSLCSSEASLVEL